MFTVSMNPLALMGYFSYFPRATLVLSVGYHGITQPLKEASLALLNAQCTSALGKRNGRIEFDEWPY